MISYKCNAVKEIFQARMQHTKEKSSVLDSQTDLPQSEFGQTLIIIENLKLKNCTRKVIQLIK